MSACGFYGTTFLSMDVGVFWKCFDIVEGNSFFVTKSLVFEAFIDLGIGWEERLEGGGGWGEAISFLLQ